MITADATLTRCLISSTSLLKSLQVAQLAAPRHHPVVPILETLLLEFAGPETSRTLSVTGYDMEHRFTSRPLPIESNWGGAQGLCVPGKQLIELLKNLHEQPLTLAIQESHALHVHATLQHSLLEAAGTARYELASESAADYPPAIPLGAVHALLTLPGHLLLAALHATLPVTGTDELRPCMMGVFLRADQNKVAFCATEGHRLVTVTKEDQHNLTGRDFSLILPRRSCEMLLKLINPRENVHLHVDPTQARIELEKGTLQVRLIDERYPDYENIIPVSNPNVLVAHRLELLASIKRLALFSNKTTHQIRLELRPGQTSKLHAEDLDFASYATESVPGTYDGESIQIGLNAHFLRLFLENMGCQSIKLSMSTPNRALLLQSADAQDGVLCLLMPVMLNNY